MNGSLRWGFTAALCAAPFLLAVLAAAPADAPVADAASRGDVEAVRGLLQRGIDVEVPADAGLVSRKDLPKASRQETRPSQ